MKKWSDIREELNQPVPEPLINPPTKVVFGHWWKGSAAIESANQIFGHENWSERLIDLEEKVLDGGVGILYQAVVRVFARGLDDNGEELIVNHEGLGVGTAQATFDRKKKVYLPLKPLVVRTAIMASKTYAVKRALRHFGLRLGADLYFDDEEQHFFLPELKGDETAADDDQVAVEQVKAPEYGPPVADSKGMLTVIRGKPKKKISDLVGESDVKLIDFMTKIARALPQFTGRGPRFNRHLKKHFGADDVSTLNWGQMVAVLVFGESGDRHPDFYDTPKAKEPKTVAATVSAVDEMAGIVAFFKEHSVPEELIDDITETHFVAALTDEDARVILTSLQTAFKQLGGLDGICDKDGKMTPTLSTIIQVAKPAPF